MTQEGWYQGKGGPISSKADISALSAAQIITAVDGSTQDMGVLGEADGTVVGPSDPLTNLRPAENGLKKYKVLKGDTIKKIASQFGIDVETIKSANPGARSSVRPGQILTILPVSGVVYDVQRTDTLESILSRFNVDRVLFEKFNPEYQKIFSNGAGSLVLPYPKGIKPGVVVSQDAGLPDLIGYFALPTKGAWNWGELHEYNAVEFAGKCGAEIYASADGLVVPDPKLGEGNGNGTDVWNDGYGLFILVEHANGTHTRYAHLGKVLARIGEEVKKGQILGLMGNTGNTHGPTGCHLHFEVEGAKNPFVTK